MSVEIVHYQHDPVSVRVVLVDFLYHMIKTVGMTRGFAFPLMDGSSFNSLTAVVFVLLPAFLLFLVIAYIVGQLFFRQDPKRPDLRSVKRMTREAINASMVRVRAHWGKSTSCQICKAHPECAQRRCDPKYAESEDVEFPYHYLFEYLCERKLSHLAELIPWKGSDGKSHRQRTKHFINILKIRLEFIYPERMSTITRNEAHVRLSSSMWYACFWTLFLSVGGLLLGFAGVAVQALVNRDGWWPIPAPMVMMVPGVVLLAAWTTMRAIEHALHYQREREVLFIMETAAWASQRSAVNMFKGLKP